MREAAGTSDDAEERLRRIELITDSTLAHLGTDDLLRELLHRAQELLDVDTAAVMLYEPSSEMLVASTAVGIEDEVRQGVRVPAARDFAEAVAAGDPPPVSRSDADPSLIRPALREHGIRSVVGAPLMAGGDVLGILHVGARDSRHFSESDVDLVRLVADRIALAVQASTTHAERAATAALQRSLLPTRLPAVPGVALDARYVPGADPRIGGDWYDVFRLPSGHVGIVIGDVAGSGLAAAVVMGRLRSALRAYALETRDPAEVLHKLDRKVTHFEPGAMATVGYSVYDPSTFRLRVSLAGHLAPVVGAPGRRARLAALPVDPPVGLGVTRHRRTGTVDVPPGGVVCFCTDGLVERRGES
ncbi:GAF domain-containing SpoIIE family protein phosphatase, partial [Saccharopolyspora taberi]